MGDRVGNSVRRGRAKPHGNHSIAREAAKGPHRSFPGTGGNSARRARAKPPWRPSRDGLSSPFPGAVRIEHRPIQSPCRSASCDPGSGRTSLSSIETPVRLIQRLDRRDFRSFGDRRRGRGVDKPLAVAPPVRNIAPFNCQGRAASYDPGPAATRLLETGWWIGLIDVGAPGFTTRRRQSRGAKWNTSLFEQPGVPPASATGAALDGVATLRPRCRSPINKRRGGRQGGQLRPTRPVPGQQLVSPSSDTCRLFPRTRSHERSGTSRSAGNATCVGPDASRRILIERHNAARLAVVDVAQIQHLPLHHPTVVPATVLVHAPAAGFLAVLEAPLGAQEHGRHLAGSTAKCNDQGRHCSCFQHPRLNEWLRWQQTAKPAKPESRCRSRARPADGYLSSEDWALAWSDAHPAHPAFGRR